MIRKLMSSLERQLPGLTIGFEWLIKRSLATLLWGVWRSGIHPFRYVRTMSYTTGRLYVEHFLMLHVASCRGRFLEFGDPRYRYLFPASTIEQYDIFNVESGTDVTIVGDIQHCPQIPNDTYDVIVCTQVLEHVANPFLAAAELYRILKPGGQLLLTVPTAYPYHAAPHDYWRYTRDSLQLLFCEYFQAPHITAYGNRLTVIATYWFWMSNHLPKKALFTADPNNPSILMLYAQK